MLSLTSCLTLCCFFCTTKSLQIAIVDRIVIAAMCYSGVGAENGRMPDRANSFQRPNNFGRHAGELMPFGFKPEFMHHWNLPQAYNPYAMSCSRVPPSAHTFEPFPTYGEESTSSHEVVSKEESSNSPTDRLVLSTMFCLTVSYYPVITTCLRCSL